MRKVIVIFFLLAGVACAAALLAGAPLVPRAVREINLPKPLREDISYVRAHKKKSSLQVFFSHQDFFYNQTIRVVISASLPTARIHYTLDGAEPTGQSPHYTGPITLPAGDSVTCTVLKAKAMDGENASPVRTHSYFVGPDVERRFSSVVFSLSTDPPHLFDYHTGILVPGKKYDEYMKANPETTVSLWRRDANYNEHGPDWERPLFVEAFTSDGRRVIAQQAGVRVHGESSRGLKQKSLRLIARKRYEPKAGKFKYPFFPHLVQADAYQAPIRTYDNLILSNGGSVFAMTRLADPVVLRLARKAGYQYASPTRSAAVFLNGAYYGHAWLMTRPNEQHFKKLFGMPEAEDFAVVAGGEHKIYTRNPLLRYEFSRLHTYAEQGLKDDARLKEFQSIVDVSNLLSYMAMELYVANTDWPRSNVRIWRYTGKRDLPNLAPDLDGRWRYILFDVQAGMGATGDPPPDAIPPREQDGATKEKALSHFAFPSVTHALKTVPFLRALLERPELAEEFANAICDLAYVHFTEAKVTEAMAEALAESAPEFARAAADSAGEGHADVAEALALERERILSFSRERPRHIVRELQHLFGYTDTYRIFLEGPGKINTVSSGEGRYFVENSVPLTPNLPRWHVFDHWLVNGQKRTDPILRVTAADAVNGQVRVRLVSHETAPALHLADAYDRGGICGFSLVNASEAARSTQGLFLSDKLHDPKKWPVPDFSVAPGGRIECVGQSYRSTDAMLKVKLNFNPRSGEVVFLSNEAGTILDYLLVP